MCVVRKTVALCPVCAREVEGRVMREGETVYLIRECPDHGSYRLCMSKNGEAYTDFDRFFSEVLGKGKPAEKIANIWIVASAACQMLCRYCNADMRKPAFEDMSMDDLKRILDDHGHVKLTFSGGEPTLHPHVFDFFREAAQRGIATQLATNGVTLASRDFCKKLIESGVTDVRISVDSLDREQTRHLGSEEFFEPKIRALENLHALNIPTSLSVTVLRGINEDQVAACIDFAHGKPFIRAVSVNGFTWSGGGRSLDRSHVMMPDEIMDLIYARYSTPASCREDFLTFQKALFAIMQIMGMKLCLYTQLMVFVRTRQGMASITGFLHMKRLKRAMKWWERFASSGRFVQAVAMVCCLMYALRAKSFAIIPHMARLFFAHRLGISARNAPSKFLSLSINTSCSVLNWDRAVADRCMSSFLIRMNGEVRLGVSTESVMEREKNEIAAMIAK